MRVSRAVILVAAVVVAGAAVAGYVITRSPSVSGSAGSAGSSPTSSATPSLTPDGLASRAPVLERVEGAASLPNPAAVSRRLAGAAAAAAQGARLVGQVVDATTGRQLWAQGAGRSVPPASTAKLLTALAALTALGPRHQLTTSTRRTGNTVYLVGGGDPTLSLDGPTAASPPYPAPASLAALARRTAARLGHTRRVRLRIDTSAWSGPRLAPGWKPRYVTEGDVAPPSALELNEGRLDPDEELSPRSSDPAGQAGDDFEELLRADGVRVVGPVRTAAAPASSRPVAAVRSAQVDQLVQRMLTVSDDDLAEALGREVAIADGYAPTFAGAAAAVTARAAALGIPTEGLSLHDTSGLSRLDRISPRTLTAVLRLAAGRDRATLQSMLEGLPVAGLTGTLAERYLERPTSSAAGVLRAKTGTLSGVNALSGLVLDREGRLLAFAFLASNAKSPEVTVPRIDRLAARLQGCGCTG
jgi:serine-type D-Ala-D-Ala carboxypeptidase/endopeptidase (penicillin-binding protein 4)